MNDMSGATMVLCVSDNAFNMTKMCKPLPVHITNMIESAVSQCWSWWFGNDVFESVTILAIIIVFSILVANDILPAWHLCQFATSWQLYQTALQFQHLCKWYEWTHKITNTACSGCSKLKSKHSQNVPVALKTFINLHKNRIYRKYPIFSNENIWYTSMTYIGDIYIKPTLTCMQCMRCDLLLQMSHAALSVSILGTQHDTGELCELIDMSFRGLTRGCKETCNRWGSEWMNENARILSAFENRLRAGFV